MAIVSDVVVNDKMGRVDRRQEIEKEVELGREK